MNIIIGGGTGFIGRTLIPALLTADHQITVVGRDTKKIKSIFGDKVTAVNWDKFISLNPIEYGAVINLTGANISSKRWSEAYKHELLASRVESTRTFVSWCAKGGVRKPHLYNASAIGYYGLQTDTPDAKSAYTERSNIQPDASFSSILVNEGETAADSNEIPVTIMRFGVVLRRGEGMLKQLEFPAKMGMGAVVGSGKQPLTWIDADDLISAIYFLLSHPQLTGVFNLTAPEFVSQRIFTKTLAHVLHRPALLWLPAPIVKILFGQMGEELLLSGQAVYPERLLEAGFKFQYPTLTAALEHEYGNK